MATWFKFYGGEYLYDPKIMSLNTAERSCWITLLCYASVAEIPGEIKHLTEERILIAAGIDTTDELWDETKGVLKKLQKLEMILVNDNGMITVINFRKRQDTALTSYERVKKFREKNEMKRNETVDNANDNARVEEKRVEQSRREEKRREKALPNFFTDLELQKQQIKRITSKGFNQEMVTLEIAKFISYWTESSLNGKQRWQAEKFFEVPKRLNTWFSRIKL